MYKKFQRRQQNKTQASISVRDGSEEGRRWVTGRYHNTSNVSDMLRGLDWRSLEQRRVDTRLTILYKIQNQLVAIDESLYLQRGTGRREYQYRQLRADKDYTHFSSSPGQSYSGPSFQVKSAWQSRFLQDSGARIEHLRLI